MEMLLNLTFATSGVNGFKGLLVKTNLWCHYLTGDHFVEDSFSKPATHFFLQISFLKNCNLLNAISLLFEQGST